MDAIFNVNLEASQSLANDLCKATDQFRALLKQFGINPIPRRANSLDGFLKLDLKSQSKIISNFKAYVDLCIEASNSDVDVNDKDSQLVWWCLSRLGLRPKGDLFNQIDSDDCIEIYDTDHVQIFRSFNMFECLSYSIEEVITHPWPELYKREQHHTDQFIKLIGDLMSGKINSTVLINGPAHWVEEVFSPDRKRALISTRIFSPLYDKQKNLAAYLSTTKVLKLEEGGAPMDL